MHFISRRRLPILLRGIFSFDRPSIPTRFYVFRSDASFSKGKDCKRLYSRKLSNEWFSLSAVKRLKRACGEVAEMAKLPWHVLVHVYGVSVTKGGYTHARLDCELDRKQKLKEKF